MKHRVLETCVGPYVCRLRLCSSLVLELKDQGTKYEKTRKHVRNSHFARNDTYSFRTKSEIYK
ncbi:hypothetical protein HanIR_Chr16g0812041 [Helianthus annuus]|nr:hypothetical protein HanIR_Chr16g0812041 [Helianthus annuus]